MARKLNVTESWWVDPRRFELAEKIGSEVLADGVMMGAWKLAFDFWVNRKNIPLKVFQKLPHWEVVLEVKLAVKKGRFIYVRGTKEFNDWLPARKAAGAKGGKQKAKNASKPVASSYQDPSKPLPSSLLSSSLLSSSLSCSTLNTKKEEKTKSSSKAPPTGPTWEAYVKAYRSRYGVDPVRNATVNSQMSNYFKRLGEEEAPQVAEFYLSHNDSFYVMQMHPVGMLLRDAEKLRTEWATGVKMNMAKAKQAESRSSSVDVVKDYMAKKHGDLL